jgi:hypothetical protein
MNLPRPLLVSFPVRFLESNLVVLRSGLDAAVGVDNAGPSMFTGATGPRSSEKNRQNTSGGFSSSFARATGCRQAAFYSRVAFRRPRQRHTP